MGDPVGVRLRACLLGLGALIAACEGAPVSVDANAATHAHNAVRSRYGLPPLAWDAGLADKATAWSAELAGSGCDLVHSGDEYGENLYWTSATATPQEVVDAWASESADYDLSTHTCTSGAVCGHFTQLVWRDTLRVGCGAATCPGGGGEIWTCKYDPPGNYVGQTPF